jgi:putative glutathione S-transferase
VTTAVAEPLEAAFASEIDAFAHGEHHPEQARRAPSFTGRVQSLAGVGRYHLYVSWASTRSHHVAILRSLVGLDEVVSLSYVDGLRDGRGWVFRRRTGPDPINGFSLLREAYEATERGYVGDVRVPVFWDKQTGAVVSDSPDQIVADLLTAFDFTARAAGMAVGPAVDAAVDRLKRACAGGFNAGAALRDPSRRPAFRRALSDLDRRLATRRRVLGADLSDADIRLWVRLARLDAGPNASGTIGPRLDHYPNVWRWATALYDLPAFAGNTDFRRFAAPFADLPPWMLTPRP